MSGIEILGTGAYVPEFVADNNKFAEFLDTSDEWITPRTGIKQRHILTDKPGYYMGVEAAKKALEDAGVKPEEVDLIPPQHALSRKRSAQSTQRLLM